MRWAQPTAPILTKKISLKPLFLLAASPAGNRFGYCTLSLRLNTLTSNLLGGTIEETDEGGGAHIDFSLASFILMHLISPPSSFVEHLSFPINLHQSLYPCWMKNCTHYFSHVVYRNSSASTDKRQVKQLKRLQDGRTEV